MNKRIYYSLSLIAILLLVPMATASQLTAQINNKFNINSDSLGVQASDNKKISELFLFDKNDAETVLEEIKKDNLPVGDSKLYSVDNPEGVVVFIPQTHMNPGTKVEDPINDSAEIAQKQIYDVISHLNKETNIDLIMVEGEKFGQASGGKSEKAREKLKVRNEWVELSKKLIEELEKESVPADEISELLFHINEGIKYLDREISLLGAPYKVMAENDGLTIYGSENPDTYQQSSVIVRNYIYQKDQLKAIQGKNGNKQNAPSSKNILAQLKEKMLERKNNATDLEGLRKIMSGQKLDSSIDVRTANLLGKQTADPCQNASLQASLEKLESIGVEKGNQEIRAMAQKIGNGRNILADQNKTVVPTANAASQRNVNPYSSISDVNELNKEIKATENQIQEVVIDKRNRETAENFKKALGETNNEIGVLQFGAGHEEGLIAELNKQNLSVIVIKPEEVLRREAVDNN